MVERWKDIPGFPSYQVSDQGRILNWQIDRIMRTQTRPNGVLVNLSLDKRRWKKTVSHLVAQAFVPNPENHPGVAHLDGNPQNNSASNLKWVPHAYFYKKDSK